MVFVASGLDASVGSVLLVLAAGGRLSGYVAAAVTELGFLRGIWVGSSRRLGWLEAKLLTKMYAPTSGRIMIDDVDLARVPSADWRARLAGAFQDFFRFELRALTSVGVGDEPRVEDRDAVGTAAERSWPAASCVTTH